MSDQISLQTKSYLLRQAVNDILDGRIAIPAFQRNFEWTEDKVRYLFDSIRKGFPIGSILLWEPDMELPLRGFMTNKLIPEYSAVSKSLRNVTYILDGRQRLTAFYGCISPITNKDIRFNLRYNLKSQEFEHPKDPNNLSILVSDIYNTMKLIDIMQSLSLEFKSDVNLPDYLNRAKELNSILQEYQIVIITLSRCTLKQAGEVFSRINSAGTDINMASMWQAISYSGSDKLLVDDIAEIKTKLVNYSYKTIDDKDILNCYFNLAEKDYYEYSQKTSPEEIKRLNLTQYSDRLMDVVVRTCEFLRYDCLVFDSKWLPYKKQFILLTYFFNKFDRPSPGQIQELRKWFFYTTATLAFQNSSMSNVRYLFNAFKSYVRGDALEPIIYEDFYLKNDYNFRMSGQSAKSCFLVLSLTWNYLNNSDGIKADDFSLIHIKGTKTENYFVTFDPVEKSEITDILEGQLNFIYEGDDCLYEPFGNCDDVTKSSYLEKFALSNDSESLLYKNPSLFTLERHNIFFNIQKDFLTSLGIKVIEN